MATREDVHRLIDAVPDDRLTTVEKILRAATGSDMNWEQALQLVQLLGGRQFVGSTAGEPVRRFASAGTLSADPDLAERAEQIEQILRSEPGTAA